MPLSYSGPPDIVDQLLQLYRSSVPADIAADDRSLDEAHAIAEVMAVAEGQASNWVREARLGTSHGIWTDQHGRDRGLGRQAGEDDESFIARQRTSPKAITEQSIRDAIAAIVASTGATGPAAAFYLIAIPKTHGAFSDVDCWCDVDSRVTPVEIRITIALIPAALGIRSAVLDALRTKVPAGHGIAVEEF